MSGIFKKSRKTEQLEELLANFESSNYRDDGLFQLGNTYAALKIIKKPTNLQTSIWRSSKKSYNPRALLRDGFYFTMTIITKNLSHFKEIVAKFPNSEEAKEAVRNARNVM